MTNVVVNNRTDIVLDVGVSASVITGAYIDYVKPDGSDGFWTASPVPDSTTILYPAAAGEIDQKGKWTLQAFIETTDGDRHGEPVEMFVERVIRAAGHAHV